MLRILRVAIVIVAFSVPFPSNGEDADDPVLLYSVAELTFRGPQQTPKDSPARDVEFSVRFRHESGSPEYTVQGFWDGDGQGGMKGDAFKVRFCPTRLGRWTIVETASNCEELKRQRHGETFVATASKLHGFWEVDGDSPGRRWYRRSDGSHQYILGNTHYSFLSGFGPDGKPVGNDIAADIRANASYFKKLRFGLMGCRYPNPKEKPFLDDAGKLTDDGNYSHRPNPRWFHQRADVAVQTALNVDLIADLILCGPDSSDARLTLQAGANNGDATPWLRYIAARYGSYPNIWICLCNEFDIKSPKYTPRQIADCGQTIRKFLPYPTPVSVHTVPNTLWPVAFDSLPSWNDHQIIQKKLRSLSEAADVMQQVWQNRAGAGPRNKPTVNDELSYQGNGDRHNEGDTIESHLGAFLGGGYGATGFKPGNKLGHYFWGKFDPAEHTAADNLGWLREVIDRDITFWRLAPDASAFESLDPRFRAMAWRDREYVLGANAAKSSLIANLGDGAWTVACHDIMAKTSKTLATDATGRFTFDSPARRAVLFHFQLNDRATEQRMTPPGPAPATPAFTPGFR